MHLNLSFAAVALLGTASALPGQWGHAWNPSGAKQPWGTGSVSTLIPSNTGSALVATGSGGSSSIPPSKPSGYVPGSGSSSVSKATGWSKSLPHGTGSYKPYPTGGHPGQPHGSGTGSVPPPVTLNATTIATTAPLPTTDIQVITTIYPTTVISTLTSFVPCSTPVSSNTQTTYYSTWLTATSWTTTFETTTTSCYTITASPLPTSTSSPSSSSTSPITIIPIGPEISSSVTSTTTLPAKTISDSTSGTCAPAETVYSTIVSYITIWTDSGAAQTATATPVVPGSSFTWTWSGEGGHAESTGGWAKPSGTAAAASGHW